MPEPQQRPHYIYTHTLETEVDPIPAINFRGDGIELQISITIEWPGRLSAITIAAANANAAAGKAAIGGYIIPKLEPVELSYEQLCSLLTRNVASALLQAAKADAEGSF